MVRISTALCLVSLCLSGVAGSSEINPQKKIKEGLDALGSDYIKQLQSKNKRIQQNALSASMDVKESELNSESTGRFFTILISDSMGESEIKRLFREFKGREDVRFVLRGLLPREKTINDVMKRIYRLAKVEGSSFIANVQLDPRPFNDAMAEEVPKILMYEDGKLVLSASGIANPRYMKEQFAMGKRGDLGRLGNTVQITERDLTEVILARSEKIDKQKMVADAKARYWDNVSFLSLPKAVESRTRTFTPELIVQRDIVAPDGTVIAFAGQQVNTLEHMPFTRRVVVFDATDEKEMQWVLSLPASSLETRYITTKLDRTLKWKALAKVEDRIGKPVFLLNRDVLKAFDVRATPTVITADNHRHQFEIAEVDLVD